MKEVAITAYELSELSDRAKEKAYNKWLGCHDYPFGEDNKKSLDAFCDIFPVKVDNYEYGNGGYIRYTFTEDDRIMELSGQRLATYIWNNYRHLIFKGKYYALWSKKEVSFKYHKGGYPVLKQRYSKVILDNSCVLTGYCIDDTLLSPIYDFLNNPDNREFDDLMYDCLNGWVNICNSDYEYSCSMESFVEECNANDWMFDVNGRMI